MGITVQKYGGTSVADIERIRNVAKRVAGTFDRGNDVVVILSAMAGVTDGLLEMASQVSDSPKKRELDVLLAGHRPDGWLGGRVLGRRHRNPPMARTVVVIGMLLAPGLRTPVDKCYRSHLG